jgi:hypothetical protein
MRRNKMKKIIFAIMALMVLGLVSNVSAITPAAVTGTIYDFDNVTIISGATVTVDCDDNIETTTSDTDGTYYVIFDSLDCTFDAPVTVTATSVEGSGSTTSSMCTEAVYVEGSKVSGCDIPVGYVDVTIPEFTVIGGAIVLLAGLGIVAYRRK